MSIAMAEPFWTIDEVAQVLKMRKKTLYEWRRQGYGPHACRMGKYLRYDPSDVREWIERLKSEGR